MNRKKEQRKKSAVFIGRFEDNRADVFNRGGTDWQHNMLFLGVALA